MTKIIEEISAKQIKDTPKFSSGDTVVVSVKVKEGKRERIQAFEGVVVAVKNRGISSSFTVRKISYGEGVERVFPLFSPKVSSITLIRKGKVRRAKLYYLRDRRGKAARIVEKIEIKKKVNEKNNVLPSTKEKAAETVSKNEVDKKPEIKTEDKKD